MRVAIVRQLPMSIPNAFVASVLRSAAAVTGTDEAGLAVVVSFLDDETVRGLNARYRGIDRVTDILSFRYGPVSVPARPAAGAESLPFGELAIAGRQMERQAKRRRQSVRAELRDLLIHGYLHLLGHDHHDPARGRIMRRLEDQIRMLLKSPPRL